MTWVSKVSPRAPEILMRLVVPGASASPTRTRPGATQAGNGGIVAGIPTALRVTVAGELVALLSTVTAPITVPAASGEKAIFSVADWLGDKMVPGVMPLALNPVPVGVTLETVTFEFPLFVSVAVSGLLRPGWLEGQERQGLLLSKRRCP